MPVHAKWGVSPLLHGVDRGRRQQARAADERRRTDRAIGRDYGAKSDDAFNAGSQRAWRIDGLSPFDHVSGRIRRGKFDDALGGLLTNGVRGSEDCEKSQYGQLDQWRSTRIISTGSNNRNWPNVT
jgi:hypothetical protein